ncbi:Sugar kinase of the NBD/HSP70 family, may contain an N-terminal HTH domain [Streptomyces sp. WMMB 714]|uniref:ROK family transcriptional regulator n=1 Tax=Streptomyces sp. WMMB 714 TaxID=1286822 RepID=UPI0005F81F50|nr:ROK family transcriptional regulator [Streptomyces sp. WMMB 714]SCK20493.1 Sugar kinase of the NBD/HSP70 family, may contain an N-terminal HTH domain [Streptomyces sp. WMMB 714]
MAGMTPGTPRVLRAMNDRAALDLLLSEGPLSRGRIGKLTGLSKPTASQLLARLEAAGLVVVTGRSEGRPGPNAQLYAVDPRAAYVAGVDVTTARVLAGVADITGRVAGVFEVPTPPRRTQQKGEGGGRPRRSAADSVVQAVEGAAKAAGVHKSELHRLVVGTPGAFDPSTGRLRYASHLPGWHSPTLLEELAAALPMPLDYDNDVNLVAVAEQQSGAARGHEDFVLLWNEQGIGAALVIGGRLHRGRTGGAGEVGFLPVPGTPLVRDPGHVNSGGFQALAGAGAVLRWAHELGLPCDPDASSHDRAADLVSRAAVAAEGEPGVPRQGTGDDRPGPHSELLRRFASGTAVGLAAMVSVLDPQLIVLSGGLLNAGGEPLRALIQAELDELTVPRPPLLLGTVTEHPVLHGALQSALLTTRDEVFDTTAARAP